LEERNSFLEACISAGIMARPSWQLMHTLPAFKDCIRDDQKNAKFLQERIVNIPSSYRSIN
ncbi:MAG: aminotransferase DegT, partial [Crocinitomicaceae bacterium]